MLIVGSFLVTSPACVHGGYLGSIGVMMPSLSSMRGRGIQAQVLAVPGADHLHRLRQTVPDAHGKRHGGQAQRVDGDGHAHAADGLGHTTVVQVGRPPRTGRR